MFIYSDEEKEAVLVFRKKEIEKKHLLENLYN